MKKIMTVLGPVAPDDLGFTSMHEHILWDLGVWRDTYESLIPGDLPVSRHDPVLLENIGFLRRNWFLVDDNAVMDDAELMTAEIADFKASGGSAMVDMSCLGLRINLPAIQQISKKTGVHVIATTGLYVESACPAYTRDMTVDQLTRLMVKEIKEGIEDSGIRAGHIGELGIFDLGDRDIRLLRAGARTSNETGLSLSVHLSGAQSSHADGHKVVDILVAEGMNPERIIMCHTDGFLIERDVNVLINDPDRWQLRLDYPKSLVNRGVTISFDCFGHWWEEEVRGRIMTYDWQRIAALLALLEMGYAAQIVLGTDTCMRMLLRRCGGEGYARLTNYVIPTLKTHGISDEDIEQITATNPARLLAY
jgi:phosphotriesterase-related protein